MTYDLFIGDRLFSSWSMRGWLMLEMFELPYRVHLTGLYSGTFASDLGPLAPAKLVPVLKTPQGEVIGESLAIAETLAERHPQAGLWPTDPGLRARARWLCAEMVGGFSDLRRDCPMQLKEVNGGFVASQGVLDDVARVETIWQDARRLSGSKDGWLFGEYSLADVFYAPVAARIVGYNLEVSSKAYDYCLKTLSLPSVQNWRKEGLEVDYDPYPYPGYAPLRAWPV
ncbi:MAG: glutathione S-transferase [Roseobacter sp.]